MAGKIFPFEGKAKRNLGAFAAGAACNDTGEEMYSPFLSYYAGNILGVTPAQYGFIEGISEAINRILKGFTGSLSDRWGRKGPVVLGYILIVTSRLLLSLVRGWAGFVPVRGLRQVGRALRDPAREASIADSVPKEQRGRAFGFLNAVDTVGSVFGPFLGLFILYSATNGFIDFSFITNLFTPSKLQSEFTPEAYKWLFMWAGIPTIISGWIIWLFLKETVKPEPLLKTPLLYEKPSILARMISVFKNQYAAVRTYFSHKELRLVTIAHMVLAISAVPMQMILFYVYSKESGLEAPISVGALLFITFSLVEFISSYPAGIIVDKLGRFKSQVLANGLCIIALFLLAFIKSPGWLLLPIILYSVFQSMWMVSRRSIIADLAPQHARGETLGTFSMLYGITSLLSPILVGILWDSISATFAFMAMAFIAVGATGLLFMAERKKR
ncbi:MAG: MFS transporter [Planctomycetes bacterium]|nr:MFS transporter [Planctomycetota bacterium]